MRRCNDIVDKIANISIYDYDKEELDFIKKYYFYLFKKIDTIENDIINKEILTLE